MASQVAIAAPWLSALVLDSAIVGCFLLLHAIAALPRENAYLDVDRGRRASGKAEPDIYGYIYSIVIIFMIRRDGSGTVVPIRSRTDSEPVA